MTLCKQQVHCMSIQNCHYVLQQHIDFKSNVLFSQNKKTAFGLQIQHVVLYRSKATCYFHLQSVVKSTNRWLSKVHKVMTHDSK